MKTQKEIYVGMQKKWVALNDIKIGSKVIVTRKAETDEDGWNNSWISDMDNFINEELEVTSITDVGINCKNEEGHCWGFPYFILEPVKEEKFYHVGMKFRHSDGEVYILSSFSLSDPKGIYVSLTSMEDGNRWANAVKVNSMKKITEEELAKVFNGDKEKFTLIN